MAGELRRPEHTLKWENLKKSARKRNALIRQNNLKTGGGKMYIPTDTFFHTMEPIIEATIPFGSWVLQNGLFVGVHSFFSKETSKAL
ncbi:unnamed protein product [Parnassius apollo]|uniref:(apollo) hypothetical protein n=1 Tax=Parnassius apollo TaxID=110799 RepID=A0A8S3WX52_PARAO|nr:unnamed protein product [Parnassius apollo]